MLFSEANGEWCSVPPWIDYLIRLGYSCRAEFSDRRRIALISMPCDSAAAGLIALGALIKDLERPDANDVAGHYDALLRHARQFLESCRNCPQRCHPDRQRCGYVQEAKGRLRSLKSTHRFIISDATDFAQRKLAFVREVSAKAQATARQSPVTQILFPHYAASSTEYFVDGEPPAQMKQSGRPLAGDFYSRLVADTHIKAENLARSYSGLCLAGRVAGETATRNAYESLRFKHEDQEWHLSELLTLVDAHDASSVSRLTFFNTRTDRFSKLPNASGFVIADGVSSLMTVLGMPCFQHSNVLGVFHRVLERDDLEALGNRIASLRQWYSDDNESLKRLPPAPRGIDVLVLEKSILKS